MQVDITMLTPELVERFWTYVDVRGPDECWDWHGSFFDSGYGDFHFKNRRGRAHRISYMISKGEIPEGQWVNHTCDRPRCVNPAHLWTGTAKDGIGDCATKGRKTWGEDHPSHKLTAPEVLEIRRRIKIRKHGHGANTLAREFGVSRSEIWAIRDRRKWSHLPELPDPAPASPEAEEER